MRDLWEFKYAPKSFDDLILNDELKDILLEAMETRPNLLLYGNPGVGKGSFVDVLIHEKNLKEFTYKINCSDETGIDVIRDKVKPFSTAFSPSVTKLMYLNEADALSSSGPSSAQKMLRQLMEDTQKQTQFILACNYYDNIIDELKSRCQNIHIDNPPAEKIYQKCIDILEQENIKFNKKSIFTIIKKCYPDIRNTIVTLRQNVSKGRLRENIIFHDTQYEKILKIMLNGDPDEVRKVLREGGLNYTGLFNYLFNKLMDTESSVFKNDPAAILLLGDYFKDLKNHPIPEIHFMHMYFNMIKMKVV